jgi:hypothetical protein
MRLVVPMALAALLAYPSCLPSMTYYVLQLRGGSRSYALDRPVRKGRVVLFHRYPDGVYLSLPVGELEGVAPAEVPPPAEGKGLLPGQTVFVGPAVEGPSYQAPPPAEAPPAGAGWGYSDGYYADYGYGYTGWWWGGGGGPVRPPRPPHNPPPALVGPNGFPMSPPGTIGSQPLPIGPNGFPILAPQPPSPSLAR